jgi:copper chaperone CopZ
MDGVIDAEANFIAGTATIKFDDTKTSVEQIVRNYRTKGFTVLGEPKMLK